MTRAKTLLLAAAAAMLGLGFQAAVQPSAPSSSADPVVAGFQKTTVASVADAMDQVTGKRGFMSHEMRPRTMGPGVPAKFAGRAVTALMREASAEAATPQLSARHSVEMIDNARPGEVGLIVIENGLDIAGLGGLMATAVRARRMAGIIIDGGVRDVPEVRSLGLSVFARSVVPSSSVGRHATVARNVAVQCAGVTVEPGDIIVAGEDGVVAVPKGREEEVLKRAQEIDQHESRMVPLIQQLKGLGAAIQKFNRI
ncbi:MAG: RraA family protein [Acidobacteria bacterium]|nr:RraA family protein [Acidobacteriota bacterium]